MAISLNKPPDGSTTWGNGGAYDVNANFTTIEDGFNGDTTVGPLQVGDTNWLGLGSSAGRITFTDAATDVIDFQDCNVGIGTTSPSDKLEIAGGKVSVEGDNGIIFRGAPTEAGADIILTQDYGGSTNTIGLFKSTGTGNPLFKIGDNTTVMHQLPLTGSDDTYFAIEGGNVGIGTTEPATALHIYNVNSAGLKIESNSASNPSVLTLKGTALTTDVSLGRVLFDWAGTNVAEIRGVSGDDTGNKDDGYLAFFTRTDGDGSPQERMRIEQGGNVAIGASSPLARLDVKGGGTGGNLAFGVRNGADDPLLAIKNNGRIGIGTTGPSAILDVRGSFAALQTHVTDDYTAGDEVFIGVDTSSKAITVTLDNSISPTLGRIIIIKDESGDAGTYNITIDPDSRNIDGSGSNATINTAWGVLRLYSDSTNWFTF